VFFIKSLPWFIPGTVPNEGSSWLTPGRAAISSCAKESARRPGTAVEAGWMVMASFIAIASACTVRVGRMVDATKLREKVEVAFIDNEGAAKA
jgi:hypothetical protein